MSQLDALLALADGTLWPGLALGALGETSAEIVFNTSMTGYQEVLTDPSYHGQVVTMTQPHIGNYGTCDADNESSKAHVAGFIVRSASPNTSNYRAQRSLQGYLTDCGIVGITDVDTRALVGHIRTYGAQNGAISSTNLDPLRLVSMARSTQDMNGLDLVQFVTCSEPYEWSEPADARWLGDDVHIPPKRTPRYHVVAYDYGIKRNILRLLVSFGCRVTVVPAHFAADRVLALMPDGVFLSNGPGDPAATTYAVDSVRALLGKVPMFGICLGNQIMGLALGGETYKLKFGHRGGNQPVQYGDTKSVEISTHNHGFAVRADSLPAGIEVTHSNLNDGCVEGLRARHLRAFAVQYHPESSPGPHDSHYLFGEFIKLMAETTNVAAQG